MQSPTATSADLVPNFKAPAPSVAAGPKGVYISTYGCQMNVNDSERMLSLLEMLSYFEVKSPELADLIIINSCSVREKPVHKVHSEVGKYRELKLRNPRLKIGVGGCVAQQEKLKLLNDIRLLDFVFGTDAIDELPKIVEDLERKNARLVKTQFKHTEAYQVTTLNRQPGVATFVNITKGCDNFCTFCVVPFTRGREKSRPLGQVVADINALVARGVKEVTLLGQNVNSYLSDCGADFADLMAAVAADTDIQRIRFTTSHPKDFNRKLIQTLKDGRHKMCEYIHLPAQSGNTEVLARMNRGYTREEYIEKAQEILDSIPGVALSTDIIVGFPGETPQQFEDTVSLLEAVPYESMFSFKYSPRPFTKAARFTDQVVESEKSRRLTLLQARHREIAFSLAEKYLNQTLEVLVEELDAETNRATGRSRQNKLVHFIRQSAMIGTIANVEIKEAYPQTLKGVEV